MIYTLYREPRNPTRSSFAVFPLSSFHFWFIGALLFRRRRRSGGDGDTGNDKGLVEESSGVGIEICIIELRLFGGEDSSIPFFWFCSQRRVRDRGPGGCRHRYAGLPGGLTGLGLFSFAATASMSNLLSLPWSRLGCPIFGFALQWRGPFPSPIGHRSGRFLWLYHSSLFGVISLSSVQVDGPGPSPRPI